MNSCTCVVKSKPNGRSVVQCNFPYGQCSKVIYYLWTVSYFKVNFILGKRNALKAYLISVTEIASRTTLFKYVLHAKAVRRFFVERPFQNEKNIRHIIPPYWRCVISLR